MRDRIISGHYHIQQFVHYIVTTRPISRGKHWQLYVTDQ
jgi:hypothetical protein